MKRLSLLLTALFSLFTLHFSTAFAQGVPFIRNYTTADYHAHNRNFDVEIGNDGTVFVANFEGLMYYDNAEWRLLHTPGITRVTVVYCDHYGTIWVGGYNYFGRIIYKPNGELELQRIGSNNLFRGEVLEIWEEKGKLQFLVNDGNLFKVDHDQVELVKKISSSPLHAGLSDVIETDAVDKQQQVVVLSDVTQEEELGNGLKAIVKKDRGIAVVDSLDRELYCLTEDNGLCSNHVVFIAYNGHGTLWGATDEGVFAAAIPSAFSHFTSNEGMTGEVLSIEEFQGVIYVGTNNGLYRLADRRLQKVAGINHACWKLCSTPRGLLVATANGVFRLAGNGVLTQLTNMSATALLADNDKIYIGEMNAVYTINNDGTGRTLQCKLEKVTSIIKDDEGTYWLQNLYGEVWCRKTTDKDFKPYSIGVFNENAATIVPLGGKVSVLNALATTPFPYPQFSYADNSGVTWLTDRDGKGLYRWKDNKRLTDIDAMLYPFSDYSIRAMYCRQQEVWLGVDNGLAVLDLGKVDPALTTKPRLLFRSVVLNGDSILWGGYGEMPKILPELDTGENELRFTFAVDYKPLVGKTLYRYRLNEGNWSVWADDNDAEFFNLSPGSYKITVQAHLANGELSENTTMAFSIAYPVYMRWYMNLLYLLLLGLLIYGLFRYRLHRLSVEKQKLERIVDERTADLRNAQHELIRQEKMATVGKLTQGLIDRILNPLNYINNFSKLSEGLVKDVEANVEDEKDNFDQDNYEDTMDVLNMLRGNLQKVSEHGQNTTRTLKAMEEMLKDRSGGIVPMSLTSVLRQDEKMVQTYYADDIKTYGIKTVFNIPADDLRINGNADQLSKTLMSLLGNAVYAVVKRGQKAAAFVPEIMLKAYAEGNKVTIVIRDNGIGIEDTIINKIFDPFFTTKTTGEAAGVGLYLSREIVQNHGGDIHVESVKNEYSEFTITLPALKG